MIMHYIESYDSVVVMTSCDENEIRATRMRQWITGSNLFSTGCFIALESCVSTFIDTDVCFLYSFTLTISFKV